MPYTLGRLTKDLDALRALMRDRRWRLDHLYRVVDEGGRDVPFRMRPAQSAFLDGLWTRNIVLKARQLGFTTLIDLLALDTALFTENCTAVVIAETKEKADDIFDRKVRFPYSTLPVEIQRWCPAVSDAAGVMKFGNGSEVKVMVSARSGTCQFLHVSEFGPVCAAFPAKAKEILTGSFPAVPTGGRIVVESTAKGSAGPFYEMVRRAEADMLSGRALSALDWRLFFFPWHGNPLYRLDGGSAAVPARLEKYFRMLREAHGVELDAGQKAWYAAQERQHGEAMWAEYPSFADEAFQVAVDGSYYAPQFRRIHQERRITAVPWEEALPVYTAWDLGLSDETTVWFVQFAGRECRVIDYYSNHGEGLPHYLGVLRERPYRYGGHFAPHDIAVRELGSGASRLETARGLGVEFERVMANKDVAGGIEAVRELLAYCWFDERRCEQGVKCLENYRKEWDADAGCFKSRPMHDWASHGADAFRTLAVAWKAGRVRGAPPPGAWGAEEPRATGGLRRL